MRIFLLLTVFLGATGCVGNFSPVQRVQDAANDLSTATRFGRMDIALERVSRGERDRFVREHASWGSSVRIVDCDIVGMRLTDKEHADVMLAVSWNRLDQSEMRVTQITQRWSDHRGAWLLDTEERAGGDVGLLGEATTVVKPSQRPVQFETITIR
jgi:hypothetical protein